MSFDEAFLAELTAALGKAGLQTIFIGNAAAILHGVPVLTHDVDLMICESPQIEKKLQTFAKIFGVTLTRPYEQASQVIRAVGRSILVDFVPVLSSGKSFESVRSRAISTQIGGHRVLVAALEDIIAAKEAAGRPKDKATLQILKEALQVKQVIDKKRAAKGRKKE